ncbi:histidine kinase N-terminal 7TM domain-containing protein [Haloprofundus halophilus]|uniref:histidine kinase N-terminal 7TM domain-containing protein n=1 Tax=Haloprofundus halophilus TaxID=2283527 RepID=UPI000E43C03F|nr:histidine kinase N-terminal 7TM domain-containing protein [Haloprofundus halophilus]
MVIHIVSITLLLFSGVVCAAVAASVLSGTAAYSRWTRYPFAALSLSGAVWAVAYAALLLAPTRVEMLPWFRLILVSATLSPVFWFVFVIAYSGYKRLLSRGAFAVLAAEPLVMVGFALTDSVLFIDATAVDTTLGYTTLVVAPGPLYATHLVYSFGLSVAALAVLVHLLRQSEQFYRKQVAVLILSGVVPLVGALPLALGVTSLDFAPMTFWVNNSLILLALRRYRLLDVVPGARAHLFERLEDGIVVLDPNRCVAAMNPAACETFGFERAPVGRPAATVVPDSAEIRSLLDGDDDHLEVTVSDDGDSSILDVTATTDGPRGSAILVFRDITERRQVERQFRALIENSHDIIVVLDAAATYAYVSPSMETVMGYDPDGHVGESPFDYIHPDDREQATAVLQDAIESGTPERAEYRYRHADGSWRTFEAVGISLLDDPAVEGIVISARDVTERRRYEQRLQVLNRVLRHDLRNDMNVVLGYADLVYNDPHSPEVREYARMIRNRATSLVDVADRTRFVDRTLERTSEELGTVDLTALVDDALTDARRGFPEATFTASVSGRYQVYGGERILVAVENLLENAVEHHDRESPTVRVAVDTATDDGGTFVELSVADDGPGIPAEEQRVVESGVETPLEHGSGIGLWLVNWILTEADGELRFDENDPRGSVVTLRFREAPSACDESDRNDMRDEVHGHDERDEVHGYDERDEVLDEAPESGL